MPRDHKLPRPRLAKIHAAEPSYHQLDAGTVLFRVHRDRGQHALAWQELRHFGPIRDFRFDPHPPGPPTIHRAEGVMYVAEDIATCLAEVFQRTRLIRPDGDTVLTGFTLRTRGRFLDLTGGWPLRIGAAHSINSSNNKQRTKEWAVALRRVFPEADGLRYQSSLTGRPAYAVFSPAVTHRLFPDHPAFVGRLDDPVMRPWLLAASDSIGYTLA